MALAFGINAQNANGFANTLAMPARNTQATGSTYALMLVASETGTDITAPTDNMGNTYPALPTLSVLFDASTNVGAIWILQNALGGTGHVFTFNLSAFKSIVGCVVEITSTGGQYAILDQSATTPNLAGTTENSPAITPTATAAVLSFMMGSNPANTTVSNSTGYNNIIVSNVAGATNSNPIGAIGGTLGAASGIATNDIFVLGSGTNMATATISFKPAAGPPPPVPPQGPMPRQLYVMP